MENASKALIMAGAILIAIMIISLSILVLNKFGGSAKKAANMDEQEIAAFNSKITPYLGNAISGSQVNALLQYCLSVNMSANKSSETNKFITVTDIKNNNVIINSESTTYDRVSTGGNPYEVKGTYSVDGLITEITIKQK